MLKSIFARRSVATDDQEERHYSVVRNPKLTQGIGPGRAVVGFDTETTGTDPLSDHIVSASLISRSPDGSATVWSWLIDPGVPIPAAATAVHGITTDQARANGMEPRKALEQITSFIAGYMTMGWSVLGFNVSYDLTILETDLLRHELATLTTRFHGDVTPVIDPLVIDRRIDRYRKGSRRLPDLMDVYGVAASESWHDAAADVASAIQLFDAVERRYPSIRGMEQSDLHRWQQIAHQEWASHYNEWLMSQNKEGTADEAWPLQQRRL